MKSNQLTGPSNACRENANCNCDDAGEFIECVALRWQLRDLPHRWASDFTSVDVFMEANFVFVEINTAYVENYNKGFATQIRVS